MFLLISAAFTAGNHMFPALGATDRDAADKVGTQHDLRHP
jgi:hypothetical protein